MKLPRGNCKIWAEKYDLGNIFISKAKLLNKKKFPWIYGYR
ncbi:hypothetical protein BN2497_451 [Janthinobacterium sp. CG23_2]|nr:hypothetical protein BN2497_451 [Janthinobacterium sp. CG23_2]CUU26623.1 hypothetical protein BN3177_451 [Janthinobacterium sp. CG23_2]